MKTPLGTEVDLGPGHILLDGDPALPAKGAQQPPLFSAHVYCGHGRQSQLLMSSCNLLYPTCIWRLSWGDPFEFIEIFGIRKLESLGYHVALFA